MSPDADGPGSRDAGRGSVDPAPEPGAPIREGGRSPLAPTADLRTAALADAAREILEGALTCLAGTAVALRGTLRSLDGRAGRWMPAAANRDPSWGRVAREAELPAELELEVDVDVLCEDPWGGSPITTPAASMLAGGRCTPR